MKQLLNTGLFIPDCDQHFASLNSKSPVQFYQHDRIDCALNYIKQNKFAIDIGAHIGLITRKLAENFNLVYAFEPETDNFDCLVKNTMYLDNVTRIKKALGEINSKGFLSKPDNTNTGSYYIELSPDGEILVEKLDNYKLPACDLIKLDVQGFEYFILKGAIKIIKKFHPVIIIERELNLEFFKKYDIQPKLAINFLMDHGYIVKEKIRHDMIMVWQE